MGQVLHGSATTTEAVRRAIQHSQESLRALAKRYGVNPKTIAKWKSRKSVSDLRTGPKEPRSTVLSVEEEAVVVAFRRHTLLPLDDCLYALQPTVPHLTRSSLHRCLQRHGISRLPQVEGEASPHTNSSAKPGLQSLRDLNSIRSSKRRDYGQRARLLGRPGPTGSRLRSPQSRLPSARDRRDHGSPFDDVKHGDLTGHRRQERASEGSRRLRLRRLGTGPART